jgi:hypothetical protein
MARIQGNPRRIGGGSFGERIMMSDYFLVTIIFGMLFWGLIFWTVETKGL